MHNEAKSYNVFQNSLPIDRDLCKQRCGQHRAIAFRLSFPHQGLVSHFFPTYAPPSGNFHSSFSHFEADFIANAIALAASKLLHSTALPRTAQDAFFVCNRFNDCWVHCISRAAGEFHDVSPTLYVENRKYLRKTVTTHPPAGSEVILSRNAFRSRIPAPKQRDFLTCGRVG